MARWFVKSQVAPCLRGCRWQQTTAVEHPGFDKGSGKRKVNKGKKEGAEGVMAKGKLRGKGDREQEETLTSQEEYVMNREQGSVRLLCEEGTQST